MWQITAVLLLATVFLFVGCKSTNDFNILTTTNSPRNQGVVLVTHTAVPTTTATPLPSPTHTATSSPTPTFTPTATAVPITVVGDPRTAILHNPEPQDNARCGIVDLLDFPLAPPDALTVHYGGQGFGQFRSRYDQYHAGEDWQLLRGRANLGVPVYAIGHGRVTYAHPHGWGTDKGTIIIRHTFADGRSVLSFYGHMDPESVTLRAGDCVVRGQKIAEIGQPRTPPHLHFEIRTHMPDEPGPGYWPVDPTTAGWLPPSPFIWNNRMASMPGVMWTRPFNSENFQYIDQIDENTLLALEDDQLVGLNVANGNLRWQHALTGTVTTIMVDANHPLLYTVNRSGQVAAYPLLDTEEGTRTLSEEFLWQVDLNVAGLPTLLPLPGGGVVVSVRQDLTAVATNGAVLWQTKLEHPPLDWLLTANQLILTVTGQQGPIYSLAASGFKVWSIPLQGHLLHVSDQIWLYASDGLYRLDITAQTAERLYQLRPIILDSGSIIALSDGEVMLAYRDIDDGHLIAFNPDGAVRWQRSYAQLGVGELQLLLHNNQPYLLIQSGRDITTQLKLYAIDRQNSTLRHIFTGGTRTPLTGGNWFVSVNDNLLLINVGGGSLAALNPAEAVSLLFPATN